LNEAANIVDLVTFAGKYFRIYFYKMDKKKTSFKLAPINIAFVAVLFILAILSLFIMLPAFILMSFGKRKTADLLINAMAGYFSRFVFTLFAIKVNVKGRENIPKAGNICFISNHQGLADIPLIVGYIPKTVGFIAKKELNKIPILNIWMTAMKCVLIDRANARNAVIAINRAIENIQNGHPMVIFPEGTRSRNAEMGTFKPGSFKLVTGSDCLAVPVTINGTYNLVETTGKITPSKISLTIHPPIDVSTLSKEEKAKLSEHVETIVKSVL
jgi:1-acyl-sn-glycerol-3-phosphate acyltransferase